MSRLLFPIVAAAVLSGLGLQAAESDAIVVPLHDASHPPTVHAQIMDGGITVRGEDRKDVSVESHGRFRDGERESRPRADGMKRIDLGLSAGLDVREDNNMVTIKTDSMNGHGDLIILVPRHTSLQLKCMTGGDIKVEGVEGELEIDNLNGAIDLRDVAGSVVAHSLNGQVKADLKSVDPTKPMSFSTLNGNIDVTLPESVKAKVSLKTDNGEILSDFDVKMDAPGKAAVEKTNEADGSFHVRVDRTLHGTINGGGPEYQFRSFNGQILIHKKK